MAWALREKGVSDITVVENDLVGGCSHTRFYDIIPYEFGPQIMYTDEERLRRVFERFLSQHPPRTSDGEYHPALLVDGSLHNVHDFPVTIANVLKHEDPAAVIEELYHVNLDKPDYSNFENYVISRIGRRLYERYIKNYNMKQWKIHPRDMDAEWARFRTLTLRRTADMFQGKWQGHPGNYNPMWDGMLEGVQRVRATAWVADDYRTVTVDGDPVQDEYDLVVSTLPLHSSLDHINICKIFVALNSEELVMPSYANSFPNNFSFTRIIEYRQQFFVDSAYTLLSFAFPWKDVQHTDRYVAEVKYYCRDYLKRDIEEMWIWTKEKVYPVTRNDTRKRIAACFSQLADSNVVSVGRSGVHAYVSKDTCIRMALLVADHLEDVLAGGEAKRRVLHRLREKLS